MTWLGILSIVMIGIGVVVPILAIAIGGRR